MKLSVGEICAFADCSRTSRNFVEGEKLLNAGHVLNCNKCADADKNFRIIAFCQQTSNLKGHPHKIEGEISADGRICGMKCSCKAGLSSKCKHTVGVLLFCNRNDLDDLQMVSSTDLKCVWSATQKRSLEQYRPTPLKNHPCYNKKFRSCDEIKLSDEQESSIRKVIFNTKYEHASIVKHSRGRHETLDVTNNSTDQPIELISAIVNRQNSIVMELVSAVEFRPLRECCETIFNKLEKDVSLILFESGKSYSTWNEERQFRITGSRCYEIYTYCSNKAPDWQKKALKYFYPKSVNNQFVKHGIGNEPMAHKLYQQLRSVDAIKCGLIVAKSNPWLGYSPDGVIFKDREPHALLEIKCPYSGKSNNIHQVIQELKYLKKQKEQYTLTKKHAYYAQIQVGMAVLNVTHTDFMIYASFNDSYLIIPIEIDIPFVTHMLTQVKYAYFNNMIHEICDSQRLREECDE